MPFENSAELTAEARRRTPTLSDSQWQAWLASMEARGGRLVLTFDGECFAEYARAPATRAGA